MWYFFKICHGRVLKIKVWILKYGMGRVGWKMVTSVDSYEV